jgi:hypothetical protein
MMPGNPLPPARRPLLRPLHAEYAEDGGVILAEVIALRAELAALRLTVEAMRTDLAEVLLRTQPPEPQPLAFPVGGQPRTPREDAG